MLQQERGCDGRVAGVGVEDGAMLVCGQKYFHRLLASVVEEPYAGRVREAVVVELDHYLTAPVWKPAACRGADHWSAPPSLSVAISPSSVAFATALASAAARRGSWRTS